MVIDEDSSSVLIKVKLLNDKSTFFVYFPLQHLPRTLLSCSVVSLVLDMSRVLT